MSDPAAHDWELWSTTARLVVTEPDRLAPARQLTQRIVEEIELAASRFRPDSEILNLGRDADGGIEVSDRLADLLREAINAARRSDGAVDPTVGSALAAIGYDRDITLVRRDRTPIKAVVRRVPGWRTLRLEGHRLFRPEGVQLDLGATAKAVAADRIAAAVSRDLDVGVLISLGGDIATAGPAPEGGWQILVQDVPADPVANISLSSGHAIATSSTVRRTWRRGESTFHHVVDPETGQPTPTTWRSVSVVAPTCTEANTVTTAALVKARSATSWVRRTGHPARLVGRDGQFVLLNGWPEERAA
jgi:FAD:protein FMN transferase